MQIVEFFGKLGMLGVTDASSPPPVCLTSRMQGEVLDPQIFAAEQSLSGCGFEHTVVLVFLSFAVTLLCISNSPIDIRIKLQVIARNRFLYTGNFSLTSSSISWTPLLPSKKIS